MVLGWEVLVIHKLISPFRTSIDYQLSFRFTLLRNQIINTSESFFGNFLVKSRSLWVTMSIFDKQLLLRDLSSTRGGMDGWVGRKCVSKENSKSEIWTWDFWLWSLSILNNLKNCWVSNFEILKNGVIRVWHICFFILLPRKYLATIDNNDNKLGLSWDKLSSASVELCFVIMVWSWVGQHCNYI